MPPGTENPKAKTANNSKSLLNSEKAQTQKDAIYLYILEKLRKFYSKNLLA